MTEPLVGVVMGSASDWDTMQHCAQQLEAFGVPFETRVLSAHRTPKELAAWFASVMTTAPCRIRRLFGTTPALAC